jgi:hypothetical protein
MVSNAGRTCFIESKNLPPFEQVSEQNRLRPGCRTYLLTARNLPADLKARNRRLPRIDRLMFEPGDSSSSHAAALIGLDYSSIEVDRLKVGKGCPMRNILPIVRSSGETA